MAASPTSRLIAAAALWPDHSESPPSAAAWPSVRGSPSKMVPLVTSARAIRQARIVSTTSSDTNPPLSITDLACLWAPVPAATAARCRSPVEIWTDRSIPPASGPGCLFVHRKGQDGSGQGRWIRPCSCGWRSDHQPRPDRQGSRCRPRRQSHSRRSCAICGA